MKTKQQNTMRVKTLRMTIVAIICAMAMPVMAQLDNSTIGAAAPMGREFQSTSTMTMGAYNSYTGSLSTAPAIGADGRANVPGAMRAPGTPVGGTDKPEQQIPIGGALLPLLLMAAGYALWRKGSLRSL